MSRVDGRQAGGYDDASSRRNGPPNPPPEIANNSGGLVFGSVCSGIEAASVAWKPLGWKSAFMSEIEAFPRSVLAHHYPETPLHGDFTTIKAGEYEPVDLLVGGTPCQSFSVAGLRGGLDDDRGNLALEYLRLADRLRPRWLVWENVPGVLSSNGGRDFGSILGGMGELGYGVAYRVLDAQHVRTHEHPRAVPQRRRRVFVVGYFGDWRPPSAVLFERHGLSGNPAPSRQAREDVAVSPTLRARANSSHRADSQAYVPDVSLCLNAGGMGRQDHETETMVIMERGRNGEPNLEWRADGTANAILTPNGGRGGLGVGAVCSPVAFTCSDQSNSPGWERPYAPTLNAQVPNDTSNIQTGVRIGSAVRRLTPRECERLQGFPDDYTLVLHRGKPAADGPRYKALGNSMAVPVMAWIGQRIDAVEAIAATEQRSAA